MPALIVKYTDYNGAIYLAFIDFQKALDTIKKWSIFSCHLFISLTLYSIVLIRRTTHLLHYPLIRLCFWLNHSSCFSSIVCSKLFLTTSFLNFSLCFIRNSSYLISATDTLHSCFVVGDQVRFYTTWVNRFEYLFWFCLVFPCHFSHQFCCPSSLFIIIIFILLDKQVTLIFIFACIPFF